MNGVAMHQPMYWYRLPIRNPGDAICACIVSVEGVGYAAVWHPVDQQFIDYNPDSNIDTSAVEWWTYMPETPDSQD